MSLNTNEKDHLQECAGSMTLGEQENGLSKSSEAPRALPRWPRYLGISVHLVVVLFSIVIIGLASHSLHSYSGTRNIKFNGSIASWPTDLNLRPAYFFLAVSSLSLACSFASSIYTFLRRSSGNISVFEVVSIVMSVVILGLWVAGDAIQHESEKAPKTDILKWSCRRKDSPTNVIVSYASTCNEQVRSFYYLCERAPLMILQQAIKLLGIANTLAQLVILASLSTTYYFAKAISTTSLKS